MPLYEYQCEQCGEVFDLLVRTSSELEEIACAQCGSSEVHRAVSLFGVAGAGNAKRNVGASDCGPGPI